MFRLFRVIQISNNGQSNNFWTTLPGILTGIAAVITAIAGGAGLIQAFNPATTTPTNSSNSNVKTKDLTVYAKDEKGVEYTNNQDKSVDIKFKAEGTWLAIPNEPSNSNIPENTKGYISAKGGDPNFPSNTTPCIRFPLGALIVKVKGEQGECKAYGEESSFELAPKETVRFLMNDVPTNYGDNEGDIKVHLSISNN